MTLVSRVTTVITACDVILLGPFPHVLTHMYSRKLFTLAGTLVPAYLEEQVRVQLDAILVPGDVRSRLSLRRAHEHDLPTQHVLALEVRPQGDLGALGKGWEGGREVLCVRS